MLDEKLNILISIEFSVELQRTLKSEDNFQLVKDYFKYETQSAEYFEGNINKKQMREGHLKQSFIYMLIDPRVSCNLPGESVVSKKYMYYKQEVVGKISKILTVNVRSLICIEHKTKF